MRRFLPFASGFLVAFALLSSVVLFAQDGKLPLVHPLLVDIHQQVPIMADVRILGSNGKSITATVPLTLDVALQVHISGVTAAKIEASSAPSVTTATETKPVSGGAALAVSGQKDENGLIYEIEEPDGLKVLQVHSKLEKTGAFKGKLSVIGEIQNTTNDKTYQYPRLTLTTYDATGVMLDTHMGGAEVQEMAPGKTVPFNLQWAASFDKVARYRIQVEASEK